MRTKSQRIPHTSGGLRDWNAAEDVTAGIHESCNGGEVVGKPCQSAIEWLVRDCVTLA